MVDATAWRMRLGRGRFCIVRSYRARVHARMPVSYNVHSGLKKPPRALAVERYHIPVLYAHVGLPGMGGLARVTLRFLQKAGPPRFI